MLLESENHRTPYARWPCCHYDPPRPAQDEILADGSRIVHKVSRQAPGRVSIISGDEEVLLDEYIEVTEHIVDYLTRFSGLAAGDLSPATSPHRLCPYKVRVQGHEQLCLTCCEKHLAESMLIPAGASVRT